MSLQSKSLLVSVCPRLCHGKLASLFSFAGQVGLVTDTDTIPADNSPICWLQCHVSWAKT